VPATIAIVSFRLGGADGVSVVAESWATVLRQLGWRVVTVAGEGTCDVVVPGLAIDAAPDPGLAAELSAGLGAADLVLVENLLTIPLNLPASRGVASVLRGRPALVHHHDPPWQRDRFTTVTELPVDDPAWRHVTINRLTEAEMAERGIVATTVYNGFPVPDRRGDREVTRDRLGVGGEEVLLLHPVRAIARKNVPRALAIAESLGATYWLPGPAEEGYGSTLEAVLAGTRTRVLRDPLAQAELTDAYAACDAVLFPSTWEGFGNPPIEAALHWRPAAVGAYPVAREVAALGFHWLDPDDPEELRRAIRHPDSSTLDHDRELAVEWFSLDALRWRVAALLDDAGWAP
jgi:glycosyltransferase involved in cell wall biosynthesis